MRRELASAFCDLRNDDQVSPFASCLADRQPGLQYAGRVPAIAGESDGTGRLVAALLNHMAPDDRMFFSELPGDQQLLALRRQERRRR
jgi:hypothetical protein